LYGSDGLLLYVNPEEGTGKKNEEYQVKHPNDKMNTQTATVWFDDVMVVKAYIGPMTRK
jgi:hypothetical protein